MVKGTFGDIMELKMEGQQVCDTVCITSVCLCDICDMCDVCTKMCDYQDLMQDGGTAGVWKAGGVVHKSMVL